jgi:hypothetical protein
MPYGRIAGPRGESDSRPARRTRCSPPRTPMLRPALTPRAQSMHRSRTRSSYMHAFPSGTLKFVVAASSFLLSSGHLLPADLLPARGFPADAQPFPKPCLTTSPNHNVEAGWSTGRRATWRAFAGEPRGRPKTASLGFCSGFCHGFGAILATPERLLPRPPVRRRHLHQGRPSRSGDRVAHAGRPRAEDELLDRGGLAARRGSERARRRTDRRGAPRQRLAREIAVHVVV